MKSVKRERERGEKEKKKKRRVVHLGFPPVNYKRPIEVGTKPIGECKNYIIFSRFREMNRTLPDGSESSIKVS